MLQRCRLNELIEKEACSVEWEQTQELGSCEDARGRSSS